MRIALALCLISAMAIAKDEKNLPDLVIEPKPSQSGQWFGDTTTASYEEYLHYIKLNNGHFTEDPNL